VVDNHIVHAENACPLGATWFGDGSVPSRALVKGADTSIERALDTAARMLRDAKRPLVYLAPELSCEAQREAIAIADTLRAAIDSITSATALGSVLAAQESGRAAATLGEVRNRADLLLFWGTDPALRYPRFWSRYAPQPEGVHVPEGRRSRTVIAVDVDGSRGPADADIRFQVPAEDEIDTLIALRAVVSAKADNVPVETRTDEEAVWLRARELGPPLLAARYPVLVVDGESELESASDRATGSEPPAGRELAPANRATAHERAAGLIGVCEALNRSTRCALSVLRGGGNRNGADAVMTWQTGYPLAVDFARGYPRYRPHDGTAAARCGRREVDCVLLVGAPAFIPVELSSTLENVACIAIGPRASESSCGRADIVIDTGVAGIHEGGTALRMDDVPLPLRASIEGPPAAATCIRALRVRISGSGSDRPRRASR